MADYGRLFSRIWTDADFTALDAASQQLYCLLVSYSTRNHAGVLPMTLKRWAKCTAGATVSTIKDALCNLAAHGFTVLDWDTEEVLIRTYVRNDEVYKQPNVMRSALKSARLVESEALRWGLHDELTKLPPHKDDHETVDAAKSLVAGLTRTPTEGFAEGFTEGFAEHSGEGEGESYVRNHHSPTPTPSPSPLPDDPTLPAYVESGSRPSKRHPSSSAKLVVRQQLGSVGYPRATLDQLAVQAEKLYAEGHPDQLIREALGEWDRREGAIPAWLPNVLGDVVKRTRATHSQPTSKMRTVATLAARQRAAENAQVNGLKELE